MALSRTKVWRVKVEPREVPNGFVTLRCDGHVQLDSDGLFYPYLYVDCDELDHSWYFEMPAAHTLEAASERVKAFVRVLAPRMNEHEDLEVMLEDLVSLERSPSAVEDLMLQDPAEALRSSPEALHSQARADLSMLRSAETPASLRAQAREAMAQMRGRHAADDGAGGTADWEHGRQRAGGNYGEGVIRTGPRL